MHNLVGYFKLNKNEVEKEKIKKLRVELERFYVLSALQNKGIGALILLKVLNITNHYGGNFLWLGIWQKKQDATRFYEF
ncbi:GNAT family N-acetyltransferase [Flavobacteriaceae bacterium]|nr:GNAT family N-acetyltransferase [Flavobacteriaceae bacterium]